MHWKQECGPSEGALSAPLTICCLYSIFHLALKLFSCHFQGHNLKGHPKIEPTADLYSRLYATAQLCLSALYAHHFTFFSLWASFFWLFCFYHQSRAKFLMKHLRVYTGLQGNRDNCWRRLQKQQPQVEQQQRVEVPFQLELFFPDQSKLKVHKPIDMSNNNLASLPHRVCTVIYTSSLTSEFSPNCLLSPLPTHTHTFCLSFSISYSFFYWYPARRGEWVW